MYNWAETSRIRKEFWITFGRYMKPVPNAQGKQISWPNYKTGVKDVYFRMKAERDFASIGIEIGNPDLVIQEIYFEQFIQVKKIFESTIEEDWDWKLHQTNDFGQTISKIETVLKGVNILNKADWSKIISFLKPRIIALDEFWDLVKPGFEDF